MPAAAPTCCRSRSRRLGGGEGAGAVPPSAGHPTEGLAQHEHRVAVEPEPDGRSVADVPVGCVTRLVRDGGDGPVAHPFDRQTTVDTHPAAGDPVPRWPPERRTRSLTLAVLRAHRRRAVVPGRAHRRRAVGPGRAHRHGAVGPGRAHRHGAVAPARLRSRSYARPDTARSYRGERPDTARSYRGERPNDRGETHRNHRLRCAPRSNAARSAESSTARRGGGWRVRGRSSRRRP